MKELNDIPQYKNQIYVNIETGQITEVKPW